MLTRFPLDHVGIAVASIDEVRARYEAPETRDLHSIIEVPSEGVNVLFLGQVELLEPRDPESPVARFLRSRGAGMHHLAFRVPDLPAALATLEAEGYRPVDRAPRPGAAGHPIAFLHPRSTGGVLIELVEATDPPGTGNIRHPKAV